MIAKKAKQLIFDYKGNLYPTNNNTYDFYIDSDDLDKLKESVKNKISSFTKSSLVEGDKVYFHGSSVIPRFKFNNYAQSKNIKRVVKQEKATKLVIADDYTPVLPYSQLLTILTLEQVSPIFQKHNIRIPDLEQNSYFVLSGYYRNYGNSSSIGQDLAKLNSNPKRYVVFHSLESIMDTLKPFNDIVNYNREIITDKVINELIGNELTVVNESNYKDFSDILEAKDAASVQTGLELLANTNYKESIFYISLLLNANSQAINQAVKNVNVKSLLDYFQDVHWTNNPINFLTTLRDKLIQKNDLDEIKSEYININILKYANNLIKLHSGASKNSKFKLVGIEYEKSPS